MASMACISDRGSTRELQPNRKPGNVSRDVHGKWISPAGIPFFESYNELFWTEEYRQIAIIQAC